MSVFSVQPFEILLQLHDHNEPVTCILAQGLSGGKPYLLTGDTQGFVNVYCLSPSGRTDASRASEWQLVHTLDVSSFAITSLSPLPPAAASSFPRVFCGVAGPECVVNPNFTTPNPLDLFSFRFIIITPGLTEIDVMLLPKGSSAVSTAGACLLGSSSSSGGSGGSGSIVAMSIDSSSACELLGSVWTPTFHL
jgi:hypothetical protein